MDPRAIAEGEHDASVEAAGPGQVDFLEAGVLVAQPSPLETPLQGPGAAVGDLAVDQQGESVLERHVAEVAARDLLEEGGQLGETIVFGAGGRYPRLPCGRTVL